MEREQVHRATLANRALIEFLDRYEKALEAI
jgi:hypothetical protein